MSAEIKLYEKNPPRIEVIKVTRNNYDEVAKLIGIKRVTVSQGDLDVVKTVSFINEKGDVLAFKIPVDPSTPYESYIHRPVGPGNDWATIRQYDLNSGYFEVVTPKNDTKENN